MKFRNAKEKVWLSQLFFGIQLCVAMVDAVGNALMEDILSVTEMAADKMVLEVAGDLTTYEVTLIQENDRWVIDKIKDL